MAQTDNEEDTLDLFQEPEGYYKEREKPADVTHRTLSGDVLQLHLSSQNPLWGHLLWQGGRTVADYLETNKAQYVHGKTVLELGAGAGLPSLICAINGATQVVVTDYPDAELIDNLRANIRDCSLLPENASNIAATGYIWGGNSSDLTSYLEPGQRSLGFDLVILADLLFNHSEHGKLLQSIRQTLKRSKDAQALVFFTPYRPWLLQKDLAFFEIARDDGFIVEKILEKQMDKVMFEEDPGDETLRRTVFGHRIRWGDAAFENA